MATYQRKITDIQSKDIYWCLIKAKQITPSCIERWSREDVILTDNQWKEIFTKTKYITKIVRYKILNLKIIHKNYASDVIVSKFDKSVEASCRLCNEDKDIMHIFCNCKNVELFWHLLGNWLRRNLVESIVINNRMKLLGCVKGDVPQEFCFVIDYTLLQARIYIHKCHIKKDNVYFTQFLLKKKKNIEIEQSFFNVNSKRYRDFGILIDLL